PLLFPVSVSLRTLHCCPTRRSSDLKDNVDIIRSYAGRQYREPRFTQPARMGNKFAFPFSDFDSVEIAAHQRDTFGIPDRNDGVGDRKSTRLNSSHVKNSYADFCLKK